MLLLDTWKPMNMVTGRLFTSKIGTAFVVRKQCRKTEFNIYMSLVCLWWPGGFITNRNFICFQFSPPETFLYHIAPKCFCHKMYRKCATNSR